MWQNKKWALLVLPLCVQKSETSIRVKYSGILIEVNAIRAISEWCELTTLPTSHLRLQMMICPYSTMFSTQFLKLNIILFYSILVVGSHSIISLSGIRIVYQEGGSLIASHMQTYSSLSVADEMMYKEGICPITFTLIWLFHINVWILSTSSTVDELCVGNG